MFFLKLCLINFIRTIVSGNDIFKINMTGNPASLWYVVSPATTGFLDRDYGYKSVAILIPHDAEVATIPHMLLMKK